MSSAFREAIQLILSGNSTLFEIIGVTMRMSLASSLLALLMGVPLGALLGCSKFPGKKAIVILTRTMIGLPPVGSLRPAMLSDVLRCRTAAASSSAVYG